MKLVQTEISPMINEMMWVDIRKQPFFCSPYHSQPTYHAHPELELVYIEQGYGKRIIGNSVESFISGDMVLVGANVPHVWLSDISFYNDPSDLKSKAIVAYFNPDAFSQVFESVKEFGMIREMIDHASKGIRIYGETKRIIAEKMWALSSESGFEKAQQFLHILNLIAVSCEKSFIIKGEASVTEDPHPDRLVDVIRFINGNLHTAISLKQVADIACMTEPSFCRYFKKRTKKSLSNFIGNLRIEEAKKMLIQSSKTIAEIAFLCGYNSSSHFCKVFKDHTGISSRQYKKGMIENHPL